ncbi:MAG: transporter [Chlorobiaceae bacterium]|nr:transporter [Chlorobiaceae bacterium]
MLKYTAAFLALFLFSANAFATHPLITDDTALQGKGKFQIEMNSGFSTDKTVTAGLSVEERGAEGGAALSYGVTDKIDLVLGLSHHWHRIKEGGVNTLNESGIGDMKVEFKCLCFESEESGMSIALKPALSVPTGNERKGLGSGALSGGVTVIATHQSRLGALHGNLGYSRNETDDDNTRNNIWHASVATEINVMGDLRAVLNTGIETNEEKGSATHPAFLLGGVIYAVSENLDLDLGLKCALNKAETDRTFLVGLASRF